MKEGNFLAAVPLTRIDLDLLLNLCAAQQSENIDDYAMEILKGTRIEKLKDKNGKTFTYSRLAKILSSEVHELCFIHDFYTSSCSYVHFGAKSMTSSYSIKSEPSNEFLASIGPHDSHISMDEKLEYTKAIWLINKHIKAIVTTWFQQKKTYPNSEKVLK
jgi:hypothetical protein